MVRYQIQWATTRYPDPHWMDGTGYVIRAKEVGIDPFDTYDEAHQVVKAQMRRDRERRAYYRAISYRIREITYKTVGRFDHDQSDAVPGRGRALDG